MHPPDSLWWSSINEPTWRPSLQRHLDVDVAIVGGGFTGLWTARELVRRDPLLRIVVLEQSLCGFGASGRNGGWASAFFPVSDSLMIRNFGLDAVHQLHTTLQNSVAALGEAAAGDGIAADFHQGGTLTFARSELQAQRLKSFVTSTRTHEFHEGDLVWLDPGAARERANVADSHGATYSPHCARLQPAHLVRGLADACERQGISIFEGTTVQRLVPAKGNHPAEVITAGGSVHAKYVVRATEGFTPTLPGLRRKVAPIYSLMVATEPLTDEFWQEAGLSNFETFTDDRHLIVYGQRTADNRIAFGGRGAPYHFGSTVEERFDQNPKVFRVLEATLRDFFPSMHGAITHQWGGPLAMPRDQMPSVIVDHESGLAHAGGYTGDGVVLSYVSANALADLITSPQRTTAYTQLPFVGHLGRKWEFEPWRWLGINAGLGLATWADHHESRRGVTSRASHLLDRLLQ